MAHRLHEFKVLSFDCYGTLIDWETGILSALRPLADRVGPGLTGRVILEAFGRHESPAQSQHPRMLYPEVLGLVYDRLAQEWGVKPQEPERHAFQGSVGSWPPFPDSGPALRYLKRHYRLVVLSNVDRESFELSRRALGVEFDRVFTAQDIGSYKPDLRNFEYMLERMKAEGFFKGDILHTAESLFHDHQPAQALGLASAWIHRRHGRSGHGATHCPGGTPAYDFYFNSLDDMAQAHEVGDGNPVQPLVMKARAKAAFS